MNNILNKFFIEDKDIFEIGIDEAGRGPLFGRVYAAAVILPKDDDSFDFSEIKDSKKFHSKKKINEVAQYIKNKAIAWSVEFKDEKEIDKLNILQATQCAMHNCIQNILNQDMNKKYMCLVDGNYFNTFNYVNKNTKKFEELPYEMIKGGDNKFYSIAAASILAKVARDNYIEELVSEHPELDERYKIGKNKGYGAKVHIEGIKQYGITEWHRKSFGICKNY